jgi:hypothetical protein
MSRDGYLPDNVSEADFDAAFPPDCPDSCDSMQEPQNCAECEEKISECVCWLYFVPQRWWHYRYGRWTGGGYALPWYRWLDPRCWAYKAGYGLSDFMRRFQWTHGFMGDSATPEKPGECNCLSAAEIADERAEARADARGDR